VLPPELEIYPGHQAGSACGVGLSGKPASTLGFEQRPRGHGLTAGS
jgi:hypothetical protein